MMNNYIFVKVVGRGSYGEVHLVKHKTDRKQYVIKKLNLKTSSKRERRSAEQEAQLLSQLRHPNIVTYRESWEGDDCLLYIVMGFCEGGDLYHRLKQQKGELLPERQVVEWFVQIAMALQYLHERNILHRDLKTQNIFLTKTNIIKVGDLGIARVLENQNDMASTLIGTPYYMSPELFSNKPYNHKSDVWALGCCVYEMSTLKHAFNAKDMNSLVYRIVEGKLPQMPYRYDPQLGDLIRSMLSKRPEDRPDVKHILRQPYIKRQISLFLEATKEKTSKSKRKAVAVGGGDCESSASSEATKLKSEKQSPSPQHEPPPKPKQLPEKLHKPKSQNGICDLAPKRSTPPPKPPPPSFPLKDLNDNMATISNINIDIPLQNDQNQVKKHSSPPLQQQNSEPTPKHAQNECKNKKKLDILPSKSPLLLLSKAVTSVNIESLDVNPKTTPNPSNTFLLLGNKPVVNDRIDTMELLREAGFLDFNMDGKKEEDKCVFVPEKKQENKFLKGNIEEECKEEGEGDTMMLLRGAQMEKQTPEIQTNLESTEKLLEPLPPVQVPAPRPLPVPPLHSTAHHKKKKLTDNEKSKLPNVPACTPVSDGDMPPLQQGRPLSARERRRLRQSQEGIGQSGINPVRRASYDVTSSKQEGTSVQVSRSVSVPFTERTDKQEKSDEEDFSSSTSSTECSVADSKERKAESSDMQDLVQMMTQTLKMAAADGEGSCDLQEFKLNRKYRDTLLLHGKKPKDLSLSNISMGSTSGPAKVRRVVEQLRTDVLKGLGVKLLDRVLEVMEEEDENKRELHLRELMGDEKYQAYAVMVRQLKFFEDMALKV
ncbi:serine/threonine-protein kinase Nek4 isoform X2 [Boleophthalmus pectinirostris]|uniref:serine/threonine-protein kinase Nek4 isoform X2 n=1 Tax=Boleophthalmus pectinirostris TaxID=150288 RepID=UPI00242D8AD0|nr:serine/threonine-protein kinase Nek4 isoform X2 [Boleophthalmus pectinirostris]